VRPSANLRFHKVAPEPKQLPTPGLCYTLIFLYVFLFPFFNWFTFCASVFSQFGKSFKSALQNVFQRTFRLNLIGNVVIYFALIFLYIYPLSNNQAAEDEMGGPCSTNGLLPTPGLSHFKNDFSLFSIKSVVSIIFNSLFHYKRHKQNSCHICHI
jgi:hypothetical protein